MDIITSHNALDFDGLASMVAAGKLYPGAVKVFSGTIARNVKQFMALYKDSLIIKRSKEIDQSKVKRIILVDTANPNRLGNFQALVKNKDIEIHIYDHHPPSPDDLSGVVKRIEKTGAATTILVEEIMAKNIHITPFDASILALGIYEDTGSLLFSSTTARDAAAVSYLLAQGANLAVVTNFMDLPLSDEQRRILQNLLNTSKHYQIKNLDIAIAIAEESTFIAGLDIVTHRLIEVENCDAVFVVAKMGERIYVVARSRTNRLRVNEVLKEIGGSGQEKAASASIKNSNLEEVIEQIKKGIFEKTYPGRLARDIMSSPVKTLPPDLRMEEAGKIMLRYGHTGLPVVEEGTIVGIISRRDIDMANIHDLGHAPVKGFMTTEVFSVTPQTPLNDIQNIMVQEDVGRLPVIDHNKLVGIVSRTDILKTLHGEEYHEDHEILYSNHETDTRNYAGLMQTKLPSRITLILMSAGTLADEMGYQAYCVGGFVRDFLLGVPNFDVDLVVEGDGMALARMLALKLGGKARLHERFKTGVVILNDGNKIDIATARTEYYEYPAALPTVENSSIKDDLYRRDFTINTLAICLNQSRMGDIVDFFGGRKDIQNQYIRILYNFSFVEDPTRIIRAIRFEQRYNFVIEEDTLRFARDAIERRMLGRLSYNRIMQELILILNERNPVPAIERMQEIGVWEYILPEVRPETIDWNKLKRVPLVKGWWDARYYKTAVKTWLIYILILISGLTKNELEKVRERYPLYKYTQKSIQEALKVPAIINKIQKEPEMPLSELDPLLAKFNIESMIYLLLSIGEERVFETVACYLDVKDKTKLEITGHDLINMGLTPGPDFSKILSRIYQLKLDQVIKSHMDELQFAQAWIKEGRLIDGVDSKHDDMDTGDLNRPNIS